MKKRLLWSLLTLTFSLSSFATEDKLIIGRDERQQITRWNKTNAHESIGLIFYRAPSGLTYICTGTVIGPRHVVTAAHCIDPRVRSYYFIPGSVSKIYTDIDNKVPKNAFESIAAIGYPGFTKDTAKETDVGIIIFPNDLNVPILPIKITDQSSEQISLAGYPQDKPLGTMWEGTGIMSDGAYKIDTFGGQSGSAVRNTNNEIIGIHSHGHNVLVRNFACLFRQQHIDFLEKFLRSYR